MIKKRVKILFYGFVFYILIVVFLSSCIIPFKKYDAEISKENVQRERARDGMPVAVEVFWRGTSKLKITNSEIGKQISTNVQKISKLFKENNIDSLTISITPDKDMVGPCPPFTPCFVITPAYGTAKIMVEWEKYDGEWLKPIYKDELQYTLWGHFLLVPFGIAVGLVSDWYSGLPMKENLIYVGRPTLAIELNNRMVKKYAQLNGKISEPDIKKNYGN